MSKILLEFREAQFNELIKKQDAAAATLKPLLDYCQDTLQIEVTDLKIFLANPKKYCIETYWDKYGEQFKNSPVQKEKLLTLTAWSDAAADQYIRETQSAFAKIGSSNYEINGAEVTLKRDPEAFKVYLREEDEELYHRLTEFIKMAVELQAKGGKPAWTLSGFHPGLASPGQELIHSKIFFTTRPEDRNRGLGQFY